MTENKPVHSITIGTIQCVVWKSSNSLGEYFRIQLVRLYKRSDTWEKSQYFSEWDIASLIQIVQQCENWINAQKSLDTAVLTFPKVDNENDETPPTEN